MGRTLPSMSMIFQAEEASLAPFRNTLARADQRALDELFDQVHRHIAPIAYAGSATPFELFLLSMILEQHKRIQRLENFIHLTSNEEPDRPS
jgi:hypothetical protein